MHVGCFCVLKGYGATSSVKSSTVPQEVKPLDGIYIHKIACGWGHTLFVARNESEEDLAKLDALPDFVP
jgi:Regulator of chromosome condensation (RCC1) repeat